MASTSRSASRRMRLRAVVLVAAAVALIYGAAPAAGAKDAGQFEVSATGTDPALAYNSASDEFLLVWADRVSAEQSAVNALRLDGRGRPLDRAFAVATVATPITAAYVAPAVAYDSRAHRYLVVWGGDDFVRARVLGPRGAPLGEERTVSPMPLLPSGTPAVAYNAVADRYLVIWQWSSPTGPFVWTRQLDSAGTPVAAAERAQSSGCAFDAAASDSDPRWL